MQTPNKTASMVNPRAVYECASACASRFFCSAFQFDEQSKVCQLGEKDKLTYTSSGNSAGIVPVYINPTFENSGKSFYSTSLYY